MIQQDLMETPNRKLLIAKASMWSLLVALFLSAFLLCFSLSSSVSFAFFFSFKITVPQSFAETHPHHPGLLHDLTTHSNAFGFFSPLLASYSVSVPQIQVPVFEGGIKVRQATGY